jgi:hypothetical protein
VDELMWSVGVVVDDAEARHLSENSVALYIMEASQGHSLRFSLPPADGETDVENLRLEVAAESARAAVDRVLGIVYRARKGANLPDRVVPVAWVAPLGALEGGESYLDQAEDLIDGEHFGLAIVSAEVHLESQAKTMIELAVRRQAPSLEEVLLDQHRYNTMISHPAGQKMIEKFLGVKVTQFAEWEPYRAHLGRRNEVVHSGKSFGREEAADSVAAVRAIWLRLAAGARAAEETDRPRSGD